MSSPRRRIETDVSYEVNAPPLSHRLRYARPSDTHLCTPANILAGCTDLLYESTYPSIILTLGDRLMSDYEVTLVNDNSKNSMSASKAPKKVSPTRAIPPSARDKILTPQPTAPFQGGLWKIHVELPDQYPYKSPSIGFVNRIFHPNIDELSGSVCLDVINQTWSPMFDMINIFEVFLPQLLRYPNPTDPLNGEAASLLMREPKTYEAKVKAIDTPRIRLQIRHPRSRRRTAAEADDDDDMSSVASFGSDDNDEAAGTMEEL
ncbi:hypothetical protein VE04_05361 [Pseudogymnoascus sp. 24MN13]|nr:hypothetical protein VE04_05361 [Pseudogymnoascus sp. 24MN13]